MKYEKKSEILHDALNFLDEDMLNEVEKLRGNIMVEKVSTKAVPIRKRISWRKMTALAASVCVLIGGSIIYRDYMLPKENISNTETGAGITKEHKDVSSEITDSAVFEELVENEQVQGTMNDDINSWYERKESMSTIYETLAQEIFLECKSAIEKLVLSFPVIDEGI